MRMGAFFVPFRDNTPIVICQRLKNTQLISIHSIFGLVIRLLTG